MQVQAQIFQIKENTTFLAHRAIAKAIMTG
jgi:hypothetical protein